MENIVGYAILFYTTVLSVDSSKQRKRLIYAIILMGLLEASFAIGQYFYSGLGRVSGTFNNPNLFAGYLVAISVLVTSLIVFGDNRMQRLLLGASLLPMIIAILLSSSRGGGLSLVVGLSFVLWRRYRKWAFYAITALILSFIVVPNPLYKRVTTVSQTDVYAYSRVDIWNGALEMMRDYPAGTGLGIYEYASRRYNFANNEAIFRYGKYQENAHNEYLQVAVELGVLGFLIFIYGMSMLAKEMKGALSAAGSEPEKGLLVGLAGGIGAIFTQSAVDFNLHSQAIITLLVLYSGLMVAIRRAKQGIEEKKALPFTPSRFHRAALLFLLVLAGVFVSKFAAAYYISLYGDGLRKGGEIDKAITAYEYSMLLESGATRYCTELATAYFSRYKSTGDVKWAEKALYELEYGERLNPLNSDLPHKKAMIYGHLAGGVPDEQVRQKLLQAVVENYQRAAELDPYNPMNHYEIGKALLSLGKYDEAIGRFSHLKDLEPNFLPGRVNLARTYRRVSRNDLASREYLDIISIKDRYHGKKSLDSSERFFLDVDLNQVRKELDALQ